MSTFLPPSIKVTQASLTQYCQSKAVRAGYQFFYSDQRKYSLIVENGPNEHWRTYHINSRQWNYMVSNMGRVKVVYKSGKERLKQPNGNVGAYYRVGFEKTNILLHRLVAKHFVENPTNLPFVDHIDGDSSNNVASNLRWVTAKENVNNPITKRRMCEGQRKRHEEKASRLKSSVVEAKII